MVEGPFPGDEKWSVDGVTADLSHPRSASKTDGDDDDVGELVKDETRRPSAKEK